MRTAFFTLFSAIAIWHIVCSIFIAYLALWPDNANFWMLTPIAFMPLFLLISYARSRRWSGAHRALAVVALVPAVWIAGDEFLRPHTPNRPWLLPIILAYLVVLSGALSIKQTNAQQVAPSNGG